MRKFISILLLLFVFTTMIACNEDETIRTSNNSNKSHFNPPSWIQGNWGYQKDDNSYEFRFSKDNFYVNNGAEMNYNNLINMTNVEGDNITIIEITTDNLYKLSLKGGAITADFEFKKLDYQTIIHISNETDLDMYKK